MSIRFRVIELHFLKKEKQKLNMMFVIDILMKYSMLKFCIDMTLYESNWCETELNIL